VVFGDLFLLNEGEMMIIRDGRYYLVPFFLNNWIRRPMNSSLDAASLIKIVDIGSLLNAGSDFYYSDVAE